MYLTLNNLMGAAAGFLFWLLLVRLGGLSTAVLGVGYTVVALGTVVGVIAKGGLDTALLQKVPGAARGPGGDSLLAFAALVGAGVAIALTAAIALAAHVGGWLPDLTPFGWALVAGTAILLVLTWLQDTYFVALGQARFSVERNVVFSLARLALPLPVIALAFAHPVPLTLALALGLSALAAANRTRKVPAKAGRHVARREFLRSAGRNVSGGAAEFLPGLLLAPLVLAVDGPESAAYFGIAWTAAAVIFQTSGALGRSALAQMIKAGPAGRPAAIRKGILEHLLIVAPMAVGVGLLAPQFLAVFGPAYASEGAAALAILCASVLFVSPVSLYLAVLRSRERSKALVAFPVAMILSLAVWAPVLDARYGLTGVALAWLVSTAPFGVYAAWQLRRESSPPDVPAGLPWAGRMQERASLLPPPEADPMNAPSLSVVLLTWNESANITACLAALARQTRHDFEVIVVDAASTDATLHHVLDAQPDLPFPVRFVLAERRISVGEARNRGVQLARAPHVAFLSADTEAAPAWADLALRSLARADLVYGRQVHAPTRPGIGAAVRGLRYHFPAGAARDPAKYASHVNAAMRRDLLVEFPIGTSPGASAVDDVLLVKRATRAGYRATYEPRMAVLHRDVDSWRTELRKNHREGRGLGEHAAELGVQKPVLAWAGLLVAGAAYVALRPGLVAVAALATAVWLPTLRRAVRRASRMPPRRLLIGVAASPAFDLAFLLAYVGGLLRAEVRNAPAPAKALLPPARHPQDKSSLTVTP